MTKKVDKKSRRAQGIINALDELEDLERYLTERIAELHKPTPGIALPMQARHAYVFYRSFVWKAIGILRDS